ncbi:hypothetical protein SAMN05192558_103371 [Actinokineospora alba]|uniref:Uncharacterized protein n=1 Tax=Actinokineospora alba TaxID=504798 RepID=A0A1H0K802_9PSEU|nr:hypothetical protein [Actinokineospora alba]TDP68013.1 hypothetical protein C8E96_3571 [Actinokineospora alba]SDH90703.1 hypothetical protein SAMN05421871_102678 [Actinokineospora alba]SDO51903.1 hypothetical protein SAMN05192558_103371 [Actinokineospora alba]
MPEGTPPLTPAQQQAQEKMRQWMEAQNQTPAGSGPLGGIFQIGATVQSLVAAAGAGQISIAPDVGDAIIKQLAAVQDSADVMSRDARRVALRAPLGGGYAEEISRFNEQLASGGGNSAQEVLTKFIKEIDALKQAVTASMANYGRTDSGNAGTIRSAGGNT